MFQDKCFYFPTCSTHAASSHRWVCGFTTLFPTLISNKSSSRLYHIDILQLNEMINNSLMSYVFIRACIFFLHYFAPLSALYCVILLILRPSKYRIPPLFEIWAIAETAFFALIYIPRTIVLQKAATHPEIVSRQKRQALFQLCLDSIKDPENYLSGWMRGAPLSEIRRENVKGSLPAFP